MQKVEIRVAGKLDKDWAAWLEGFSITHTGEHETSLAGPVEDQAALYGLIAKLRDLGVRLISIRYEVEMPGSNALSGEGRTV